MNTCSFEIYHILYQDRTPANPKIWGCISVDKKIYSFWCHDRGAFIFKRHDLFLGLNEKIHNKLSRSYIRVLPIYIDNLVPNFIENLKQSLVLARLSDNVRQE
jgi:hypothetical protein